MLGILHYFYISVVTCDKPTINDGSVEPDDATIVSGEDYTLTCDTGFELSGSPTIACTEGVLPDPLPSCVVAGIFV